MARRSNGEGTVFKGGDGYWRAVLTVGVVGGKQQRKYRKARTQAEARAKLKQLQTELDNGGIQDVSRITVSEWFERWLTVTIGPNRSQNTEALYRSNFKTHIEPTLGAIALQKLSPMHVEQWLSHLQTTGVKSRAKQSSFQTLKRGCRHAVKMELIRKDPTGSHSEPSHEPEEIFPFEPEEAHLLLKTSRDTRWHALYALALMTGMRQGELLGLHWENVNLKASSLFVCQQCVEVRGKTSIGKPKTKSSIRTVDLPELVVAALKKHQAIMLAEGQAANPLVFPGPEGGLLGKTNFRRRCWAKLLLETGIRPRGFHHTRHTYATLALGAGVPLHVVSRVLGHARPSITADLYAHALRSQQEQATVAINQLFSVDAG